MKGLSACIAVLAATILFAACSTQEDYDAERSESFGPELNELFRIGDESMGDSILFGGIGELVAVDRSGRIFVGDGQDSKIYVFTADGQLVQTIGRRGRGPGEFEWLESLYVGAGDTLYVFDSQLERLSAFEPDDLELAYDFSVPETSFGLPYYLVGGLDGEGFLITYGWPVSPGDAMEGRRLYVLLVDWTGQIVPPPLHYLPAAEWLVSAEGEDRFAIGMPFGRDPVYRLGLDGKLYAGWTESIDITVIAPDGVHSDSSTHALNPIPLTQGEVESFVEGTPNWYQKAVLAADLSATKPAYETFIVDDRNWIWIKTTRQSIADTTARWLILDSESRLRGQMQLPARTNLRVIREGRAYAAMHGEEIALAVFEIRE